eukprot:scaffold663598_cov62-Prasinocladus_malaysianus.AAC.1
MPAIPASRILNSELLYERTLTYEYEMNYSRSPSCCRQLGLRYRIYERMLDFATRTSTVLALSNHATSRSHLVYVSLCKYISGVVHGSP